MRPEKFLAEMHWRIPGGLVWLLLLLWPLWLFWPGALAAAELRVTFAEPWPEEGRMVVWLFSWEQAEEFPLGSGPACVLALETALESKQEGSCVGLAAGRYALFYFWDENRNARPDHHWYGPPKERIGFSGGAGPGLLGPPAFEEAAFDLPLDGLELTLPPPR